jgi:hypothetical protein
MEIDNIIIQKIRPYKAIDAIAKTAALLLVPELSANNVRIEHLLNLIVKNAKGKKIFNRGVLHQILNIKLSSTQWAWEEDPPEELFSGNIALSCGNFLMLEGLWTENITGVQTVLDALQYLAKDNNKYSTIYKTVCDILKISDAILSKTGISAYMLSSGLNNTELPLPDNDTITDLSCSLIFDVDKLNDLNISEESIELFVLKDITTIDDVNMEETTLHRYPIIKIDDKYVVIPSFLGFAIRKFVLSNVENNKLLDEFGRILFNQQVHKTFRSIKEPLIENTKLSIPDELKLKIKDHVYRIDNDKIAHIILIADTLENKADKNWASSETLPTSLISYMENSSEELSQEYHDGIIILIFGSIGGGIFFGTNSNFANYKLASFNVQDFELLLHHKDFSLLKFWKCKHEQNILFDKGTVIMDYSGDINLYAFWLMNNYCFVPHDNGKPSKYNFIATPTDCLLNIRKHTRSLMNLHSAKFRDEEYLVVQRKDINSYFQSYNENRIYIAIHCFFSRMFLFLIEGNTSMFWLHFNEVVSARSHEYFELTYKIFDLIVFWLEKGIEQIEDVICNDKPYIFHIDVSFINFEKYSFEEIKNIQDNDLPVKIKYNFEGYIYIIIDIAFIKKMFIPENTAEQELIATIINTIYNIVNHDEQVKKYNVWGITKKIFKYSKHSRQLHFFDDSNIEDILPVTRNNIIFLPKEEISSVENSLDFSISIIDKQSVLDNLNALVNTLYTDLINRLVEFDKKYLIIKALENNEKIMMESGKWNRTTASMVSSHDDSVEARETIKKQISLYAKSSQASRILSEIALCHCSNNGREISTVEIEYLLAEVYKIFEFGRISDALYYDIIGIDLFGLEEGMLFFRDNTSIDKIMNKYQNTVASHDLEQNIKDYDKFYKKRNQEKQDRSEDKLLDSFIKAYEEEFGFSYELPLQISFLLAQFSLENNKSHLDLSYNEIIDLIISSPIKYKTTDELKKCIDFFTLNPRDQFEEQKESKYFRNNNVWLFKRPLSLLFKPFIKIATERFLIFPRLLCKANEYFFNLCYYGELDHELFGKKMLTYFGHRRNEIGKVFNDNVAKWFIEQGYRTKSNLQMKTIGVKKKDVDLGDIDVLVFNEMRNSIYIIECKNLERAMTPKDMGQQIKRFLKGNDRWLSRHIARYKWIMDNKDNVIKMLKIGTPDTKMVPILLVNDIIPIQFMNTLDYPTENIITMSDLEKGFIDKAKEDYYPKDNKFSLMSAEN